MADLDPEVQVKLIEISKELAREAIQGIKESARNKVYLENFESVYKQLVKITTGK